MAHIALNTFREAARDKILYVILFFALAMVVVSRAIGWISVGIQEQVVKHFSLAILSFFGALIAVFVGTSLIHKETDKRTIYTILSKPVYRWQFVFGKFFGLAAILLAVVIGTGAFVCAFIVFGLGGTVDAVFVQAIGMVCLELIVITSVAILLSTIASPILSAIITFAAYLVGQVTHSFVDIVEFQGVDREVIDIAWEQNAMAALLDTVHWWLAPLSKVLYTILPNLSYFNLRNRVIAVETVPAAEWMHAILYAVCYSLVMLVLAALIFERKRF
jgi:ABC-type transport system involved in multi-copper enzyme maturation permease subunit